MRYSCTPSDKMTHASASIPARNRVRVRKPRAGEMDGQMSLALEPGAEGPAYVVRVKGDRMQRAGISDGDLVAIRKNGHGRSACLMVTRLDQAAMEWVANRSALPAVTLWGQPVMLSGSSADIEGVFVGVLRQGRALH